MDCAFSSAPYYSSLHCFGHLSCLLKIPPLSGEFFGVTQGGKRSGALILCWLFKKRLPTIFLSPLVRVDPVSLEVARIIEPDEKPFGVDSEE